jgi:hypothetical protein
VLRRGLELNGVRVTECRVRPAAALARYPALVRRWSGVETEGLIARLCFVPEFA